MSSSLRQIHQIVVGAAIWGLLSKFASKLWENAWTGFIDGQIAAYLNLTDEIVMDALKTAWELGAPLVATIVILYCYHYVMERFHRKEIANIPRGDTLESTATVGPLPSSNEIFKQGETKEKLTSEIKDSILAEEHLGIGFSKSGSAQIHLAVKHVAKHIGDIDAQHCYPSTLIVLRQKAVDGALHMRGRKQLDVDGMVFRSVHTDIPKEYWATSTIGALATAAEHTDDTHTNPETAFSWGPKGVYERNRYADLRVEWSDILRLWPKES